MIAYKTWPASINNGQRACHKPLNWVFVLTIYGVGPHAALTLYATPFYGGGTPCHKALNWAVVARDLKDRAKSQKPATINNGRGALAYSGSSGSCHMTLNWVPPGPMPLFPGGLF
jgi:hypothetical protein